MNDRRRLQRIIRVKERIHDFRRNELAEARERVVAAEQTEADALECERSAVHTLLETGEVNVLELASRAALVAHAGRERARASANTRARHVERDTSEQAVAAAAREVRALEVIDERAAKRTSAEDRARDRANEDEAAATRRGTVR